MSMCNGGHLNYSRVLTPVLYFFCLKRKGPTQAGTEPSLGRTSLSSKYTMRMEIAFYCGLFVRT